MRESAVTNTARIEGGIQHFSTNWKQISDPVSARTSVCFLFTHIFILWVEMYLRA